MVGHGWGEGGMMGGVNVYSYVNTYCEYRQPRGVARSLVRQLRSDRHSAEKVRGGARKHVGYQVYAQAQVRVQVQAYKYKYKHTSTSTSIHVQAYKYFGIESCA